MANNTYNRIDLTEALISHIKSPTHQSRELLFAQILTFSTVKAKAHLRPYFSWWAEHTGEFPVEEMGDYSVMKFLNYLESDRFDCKSWMENPMANLNRFFKSRFLEWCRSEMNRLNRQSRVDATEFGWTEIESSHPSPEQELIVSEIQHAFENAVNDLPPNQKAVISGMRQGRKTGEIGKEHGLPLNVVYEAARSAKNVLRRRLRHLCYV